MLRQKLGVKLCLALVFFLSGCRKDPPPQIEVCINDGFGGANCSEIDGSRKYRTPSEMKNYWSTNQQDQAAYTSWCYKTSVNNVIPAMAEKEAEIKGYPVEVVSP
jgi:hypothetical protein